MARKKIETIINEKIYPFSLNEKGRADIAHLVTQYKYDTLKECVDIGVANYFRYDDNGQLIQESVNNFLNKLGGIAHNKSLPPIEQEILHLKNKGKYTFRYWRDDIADEILHDYVKVLRVHWTEQMVVEDLKGETVQLMNRSGNWSTWTSHMRHWIEDIKKWGQEDTVSVQQSGTILPDALYNGLQSNIQSLCKQINASYENNLFDCTAVIMRRLLESLLVLCYQNTGTEAEIMDKSGCYHITLDKIIKNAEQNKTLALSANTRKEMALFKDLGNYSAHKIWYNCTQQDIKPHILKYRTIIEELMYKSGVKK